MTNNDFIHICMGLHDPHGTYSVNVLIVMYSVIHKTSSRVKFHIFIDDSVSEANKEKMRKLTNGTQHEIEFCMVDMEKYNIEGDFIQEYTVGALMRLLIPDVLPDLTKTIYMDADLLINKDVAELWNIDITDVALAAVSDSGATERNTGEMIIREGYVRAEDYFNSGLLLLNLDKIREMGVLVEMAMEYLDSHRHSMWPDQDALNYIYRDSKILIDECWNILVPIEREKNQWMREGIYHFAGKHYLWTDFITEYDMRLLYTKMVVSEDAGIAEEVRKVINSLDGHIYLTQRVMSKLSRRNVKCIFYGGYYGSMKSLIEIIGTKYGDYFVLDDDKHDETVIEGIPTLPFEEIRGEIKGAFVVFVMPEADNYNAISKLENIGLRRDEDFFVPQCVMTVAQGGYLY